MRDPYAGTKALQEFILTGDPDLKAAWILRPGIIWGPGRSWHSLQGFWASKLHVTIGSDGELPLSHVYSVAALAITAAEIPPDGVQIVNIYDDDRPTRARFLKAHKRCYGWPHFNLSVPYGLWSALIPLFAPISHRLPGLFQGPILRARIMPLRFPNTKLRSVFGGEDIDSFEDMMARTKEAES
jgi:nucleoside-diphosphate-sugar epimerase